MEPSELCAVWGCLHDGYIVATSTSEGRVWFDVLCRYMAEALGHPEQRVFRVTVCEPVAWEPWEHREGEREPPSFEDIAGHEADVLSAEEVGSQVSVTLLFQDWNPDTPSRQSGGRLLVQAEDAVLGWADGEPLTTADVWAASARYWDAFGSTKKDRVLSREEAIELLAGHHVQEMDDQRRLNDLHDVSQESWEDVPGWSDMPPAVVEEIRAEALSEPPSSRRYQPVLMLPARGRLAGARSGWLAEQLAQRGHDVVAVDGEPTKMHPCPCCGRRTLADGEGWEICVVCWWEDDTSESRADRPSGANAGVSLTAARANFLRHGLFDPACADLRRVADPPEKYAVGRLFGFDDDGDVVELSASAAG